MKSKVKLYSHYKSKRYQYIDEVRHSESLEELVLYSTRHENKLSSLWVRPKDMFFEDVEVDGELRPRFAPVDIKIKATEHLTDKNITDIVEMLSQVFDVFSKEELEQTLSMNKSLYFVYAEYEDQMVAFKLGYAVNQVKFYSWLGAVAPDYRGVGVASMLMQEQHEWCKASGFKFVETRTKNKWRSMLLLNIKNGFDIVGTYSDSRGESKIILSKKL